MCVSPIEGEGCASFVSVSPIEGAAYASAKGHNLKSVPLRSQNLLRN